MSAPYVGGWCRAAAGIVLGVWAAAAVVADGAPQPSPRRIVSLSPNLTELIFELGAGERVVGVSDFCRWPPEVARLPRCGGWSNPNLETIARLQPDLIVVLSEQPAIFEFAAAQHIAIEPFVMRSAATVREATQRMGRLLGVEDRATSLTARLDAELAEIARSWRAKIGDTTSTASRPAVFLSIGRRPGAPASILTCGRGEFLGEAVELAGGRNVFADAPQPYPTVSRESLLVRRPDVILEITGGEHLTPERRQALIDDWRSLPTLPAVRTGRIVVLEEDYLLIAGPRLPQIVRTLAEAIHRPPVEGTR